MLALPVKALTALADVLGVESDAQVGQFFYRALKLHTKMFAIATDVDLSSVSRLEVGIVRDKRLRRGTEC